MVFKSIKFLKTDEDVYKRQLLDTAQTQVAPNKATEASKEDALPLLNVGEAVEKALGIEAENTDKGIYEKYIKAAKVTTVQGKWTEDVYLRCV